MQAELDTAAEQELQEYIEWLYLRSGRTSGSREGLLEWRSQQLLEQDRRTFEMLKGAA